MKSYNSKMQQLFASPYSDYQRDRAAWSAAPDPPPHVSSLTWSAQVWWKWSSPQTSPPGRHCTPPHRTQRRWDKHTRPAQLAHRSPGSGTAGELKKKPTYCGLTSNNLYITTQAFLTQFSSLSLHWLPSLFLRLSPPASPDQLPVFTPLPACVYHCRPARSRPVLQLPPPPLTPVTHYTIMYCITMSYV